MKHIIIYCLFLIASCENLHDKLTIMPLKALDVIDTVRDNGKIKAINKLDYYKVIGFRDDKATLAAIDSFAIKNRDPEFNKYNQYSLSFNQAVDETNKIELKQHPDRYYNAENAIYEYIWIKGKFIVRNRIKNGVVIEKYDGKNFTKNKVEIKNITDDK